MMQSRSFSSSVYVFCASLMVSCMALASKSWLKGSSAPSVTSLVVDEERMRPGHWLC